MFTCSTFTRAARGPAAVDVASGYDGDDGHRVAELSRAGRDALQRSERAAHANPRTVREGNTRAPIARPADTNQVSHSYILRNRSRD